MGGRKWGLMRFKRRSIAMINDGSSPAEVLTLNILSNRGKTIRPKTSNQKRYVDALSTLKSYEKWRRSENLAILGFTDFLDRLLS